MTEPRRRRIAFAALAAALPLSVCLAAAAGSVALPPGSVLSFNLGLTVSWPS